MHSRWRIFLRWYQDHQVAVFDLVMLLVASAVVCGLIFSMQLAPTALRFAREHATWRLESVALCLAATWVLLVIFAWRRWHEMVCLLETAETDALTGLENRRRTLRVLAHEFDRTVRYGRPLSVVIFDIDHFKRVNDRFGHPVGDEVLKAVARRIQRKRRVSDHLGRWGGEEFILICPETEEAGAIRIAERMRRAIKQRRIGIAGHVTASFGVAAYGGGGDYAKIIEQADHYLYVAKQSGRDCVMSLHSPARPVVPRGESTEMDANRQKTAPRRA